MSRAPRSPQPTWSHSNRGSETTRALRRRRCRKERFADSLGPNRRAQERERAAARAATDEGHADERGTREYNIAPGAKRAQNVREYLASRGIDSARMRTISYGKERPVAICDDISCWSQNRRSVIVLHVTS